MLARQLFIILILFVAGFSASCQHSRDKDENGRNPIDNRLIGKWDVRSKTDTEEVNGAVKETDRDVYQPGEKTYEFTKDGRLVITDGFGRHQTTLPVQMTEGKLYVGEFRKGKEPYSLTFTATGLEMVKREGEQKDGQTIVEQEVVVLERHL